MLPCLIFEDEHLLVIHKPAGINTHAPDPHAGEGIYDWLRSREPRWASLAIVHRLDKETSGVMVFGKTHRANRSLTGQFAGRKVRKKYILLTDRAVPRREITIRSALVRAGGKYVVRRLSAGADFAETQFVAMLHDRRIFPTEQRAAVADCRCNAVMAIPLTGRTHQIRVHAASRGFPVLGDTLYGGTPFRRVCLHAAELTLKHPATDQEMTFESEADFDSDTGLELRRAFIDPGETNAFRVIHGGSDGWPGWYVDQVGQCLLSQSELPLNDRQRQFLARLRTDRTFITPYSARLASVYHRTLLRHVRRQANHDASPQPVLGEPTPERFVVCENGVRFELSFSQGCSFGLFLDQRDNRHRFLTGYVGPGFLLALEGKAVLNTFAYTCGFSVCAALAGARVTSLDLSKKSLDWGKRNFALNKLDENAHEFIHGDAQQWLRRLAKKGCSFDVAILDPPTFSQSKESGAFRAKKDYGSLAAAILPLVRPGGVLLACTNAADWPAREFLGSVEKSIRAVCRRISQQHYSPQPPDFPVSRNEPAYLKTVWIRID